MSDKTLHIAMYPWFAFGHFSPFLHLSNKLAERGHKISFLLPPKPKSKLEPFNLHPHLITFIPITLPHVDGLPPASETTADVPSALVPLLMVAMDLTQPTIEFHLKNLKPHFIFFDFTHWLPALSRKLNIKSVAYSVLNPAANGYILSPERTFGGKILTETDLMESPPTFPPSPLKLSAHESRCLVAAMNKEFGNGISFYKRLLSSSSECDAIAFNTCIDMEGPYCDYIEKQFHKQLILAGPLVQSLLLCEGIEEIPTEIRYLISLRHLFEDLQNLNHLRLLIIARCKSLISLPQGMNKLIALKTLFIMDCETLDLTMEEEDKDGDELINTFSLKKLKLEELPKLVDFPNWLLQGSNSTLQFLGIADCNNLKELPAYLQNMESLQELRIQECGKLGERCESEKGEDWYKIAHIPKLIIE